MRSAGPLKGGCRGQLLLRHLDEEGLLVVLQRRKQRLEGEGDLFRAYAKEAPYVHDDANHAARASTRRLVTMPTFCLAGP